MPFTKITYSKETPRESTNTPTSDRTAENKNGRMKYNFTAIIVVVAIVAVAGCVLLFYKYYSAKKQLNFLSTPQAQEEIAKKEIQELLNKISKHIMIPQDEQPTVATVTDAEALKKEQAFYQDAQNGDKVVIFVQAKKAIIYNEAKDILVNVGPIFVNENSAAAPVGEESVD